MANATERIHDRQCELVFARSVKACESVKIRPSQFTNLLENCFALSIFSHFVAESVDTDF